MHALQFFFLRKVKNYSSHKKSIICFFASVLDQNQQTEKFSFHKIYSTFSKIFSVLQILSANSRIQKSLILNKRFFFKRQMYHSCSFTNIFFEAFCSETVEKVSRASEESVSGNQ